MSNLGPSLRAAIAGTALVAGITATPELSYVLAMIVLAAVGCIGRRVPNPPAGAVGLGRTSLLGRRHSGRNAANRQRAIR
ncbi:hypothetical protein FXW78_25520 [Rhodococcus opacus]|nr:hypothetical protein [Rhodococcus opacus]